MVTSLPDYDEPTKTADLLEHIFRPTYAPLGLRESAAIVFSASKVGWSSGQRSAGQFSYFRGKDLCRVLL